MGEPLGTLSTSLAIGGSVLHFADCLDQETHPFSAWRYRWRQAADNLPHR